MITNGHPKAKEANVVASFSELAHDVVELGELQAQLLKLDAGAAWQRMKTGIILVAVSACVLLGCIPIVLLTLAEALTEYAGWSRTVALLTASVVGALFAGGLGAVAWQRLKQMLATFDRSRDELNRNLAWIKTNLRKSPAREWQTAETSVRS